MTATDSRPRGDFSTWTANPVRPPVIVEITWLVLCGRSALVVLVVVARRAWPVWWLMIAGLPVAWAGDARRALGEHAVDTAARRRTGTAQHRWAAARAGEHR